MAVDKQALVASITKFRTDTASAVTFHDSDLTNSAITRRRHHGVMAARGELLKSLPAEPDAPRATPASVLAGRAPRTADQVAVAQHEFALVERLLASGQPVVALILGATPGAAGCDPRSRGGASRHSRLVGSGVCHCGDVQRQAFARLVELGDPNATIARDAQSQFDEQAAWREVVKDTIEGRATGAGLTALFQADREGFDLLHESNVDPVTNADTAEAVRRLDRPFNVDTLQAV